MPYPSFILVAGFIAATLIYSVLSWWFSNDAKIRRALTQMPQTNIHDAQVGEVVKIIGTITPTHRQLKAPLSGRECVLNEVLVEEYRGGRNGGRWVEIIRDNNAVDFLLEDATGRALVRTRTIRVHTQKDASYESGFRNDATPQLEAFLARHGEKSVGWVFNRRLRYVVELGPRSSVRILPPTHDAGKALEFGYIATRFQAALREDNWFGARATEIPRFAELA